MLQDSEDDSVIQTETDGADRLNENSIVKNEVMSEADFSEAISLASLKRKRRKKHKKKVSNPELPAVKVETDLLLENDGTGILELD